MSVRLTRERSWVRAPLSPLRFPEKGTVSFSIIIFIPGGVAQLGERRVRNAKAEGSNPFVSIKTNCFLAAAKKQFFAAKAALHKAV